MPFAYNIILIEEIRQEVNSKLEFWTQTLNQRIFTWVGIDEVYMHCKENDKEVI